MLEVGYNMNIGLQGELRQLERLQMGLEHLQPDLTRFQSNDLDYGYPIQSRFSQHPAPRLLESFNDSMIQQRASQQLLEQQLKFPSDNSSRLLGAIKSLDRGSNEFSSYASAGLLTSAKQDEDPLSSPRKRSAEPMSPGTFDHQDLFGPETEGTTGERRVRMREKNRNAQRRYRERQKAQINRLQAEIDALTEKLQRSEEEKAITLEQNKMLIREMQEMQQMQIKRQKTGGGQS